MILKKANNLSIKKALITILSAFFISTQLFAQKAMYHAGNRNLLTSAGSTSASNALDFDGVDDYVAITNGFAATNEVTYEAWVNTQFNTDFKSILDHDNWNTGAIHFQFSGSTLRFDVNGAGDNSCTFSFSQNTWYHIAGVYSKTGGYIKFYVNGVLINTINPGSMPTIAGSQSISMGAWGGARYFKGAMDDVRIWNVARTQTEIQNNMNNELSGSETGLVAYYSFNQGIAAGNNSAINTVTDKTANALNGTLNNFAKTGATSNFVTGKISSFNSNTAGSVTITNGLVLNLDAGNTTSYPGTGTTWTDLSGNGNNGTLNNSPSYNSTNGGSFLFDGSSEYVSLTTTKLPTGTSDRTVIAFVKTPTSFAFLNHIIHWGSTSTNQAYGLTLSNGQVNSHTWGVYPGQGATVSTATNYCVAASYTHSSTLHKFWINGVSQGPGISASIVTGTADARIGQRITGAEGWGPSGQIYQILVYNRSLSNAEILQIFNDQKGRYGL
jgi:hypothetical protein